MSEDAKSSQAAAEWKAPDVLPPLHDLVLKPDQGVMSESEKKAPNDLESALQQIVDSTSIDLNTLLKNFRLQMLSVSNPLKLGDEQKQALRKFMDDKKQELQNQKQQALTKVSSAQETSGSFVDIAYKQIEEYDNQMKLVDQALSVVDVTDPQTELLKHPDVMLEMLMDLQKQVQKNDQDRVLAQSKPGEDSSDEATRLLNAVDPNVDLNSVQDSQQSQLPPRQIPFGSGANDLQRIPRVPDLPAAAGQSNATFDFLRRNEPVVQNGDTEKTPTLPQVAVASDNRNPGAPVPAEHHQFLPPDRQGNAGGAQEQPQASSAPESIPAVPANQGTPEALLSNPSSEELKKIEDNRLIAEADAAMQFLLNEGSGGIFNEFITKRYDKARGGGNNKNVQATPWLRFWARSVIREHQNQLRMRGMNKPSHNEHAQDGHTHDDHAQPEAYMPPANADAAAHNEHEAHAAPSAVAAQEAPAPAPEATPTREEIAKKLNFSEDIYQRNEAYFNDDINTATAHFQRLVNDPNLPLDWRDKFNQDMAATILLKNDSRGLKLLGEVLSR